MIIILLSSLARLLRLKRSPALGHGHTRGNSVNHRGSFGRRGSDVDAENRLIDQLDEEWED